MKAVFLALLLSLPAFAQQNQVQQLSQRITEGLTSDSLKVRAIYEWVASNIAYDIKLSQEMDQMTSEEYNESQEVNNVLSSNLAVCKGYSVLFKELCVASGFQSEYIRGYCKSIDKSTGQLEVSKTLHAWNAVKLNDEWYLTDLTWSAGTVDSKKGNFYKNLDEEFYLQKGNEFVKRHLPYDPVWQLLEAPISKNEFFNFRNSSLDKEIISCIDYAKTLSKYFELSPTDKKLSSYRRSLAFDSKNDEAKGVLGNHHFNLAKASLNEIEAMAKSIIWHKNATRITLSQKSAFYKLLNQAEEEYAKANVYFSWIPKSSNFRTMAEQNKSSIQNNLEVIADFRLLLASILKLK